VNVTDPQSIDIKSSPPLSTALITVVGFALTLALVTIAIGLGPYKLVVLVGVGALITGLIVFYRPEVGAYLLIVSLFMNLSSHLIEFGLPGVNKPLVGLVLVSLVANHLLREPRPLRIELPEMLLFGFGVVSAMTFFVADDQTVVLNWVVDFAKDVTIALVIVYALRRSGAWQTGAWLLIITATLLAALGAYQVVTGNTAQTFAGFATIHFDSDLVANVSGIRLEGPVDDPNYYGQMMVSVWPLALYRLFDERDLKLRLLAGLASLLIGFAVIYSYSRGAFLALLVVLALILIERKVGLYTLGALLLVGVIAFSLLPNTYIARVKTLSFLNPDNEIAVYRDSSLRGRTSEVLAGLLMYRDNPILGVGVGNYFTHYLDYAEHIGLEDRAEARHAHSLYVEILAETGTLGFAAFIGFLAALFTALFRTRRYARTLPDSKRWLSWTASLQIGVTAYLVTSIFLHGAFFRYFLLVVALALSLTHVVEKLKGEMVGQEQSVSLAS
jgi:putative inorganic carbon (HCO3(-)) transporter